jgi:hypothetical protein
MKMLRALLFACAVPFLCACNDDKGVAVVVVEGQALLVIGSDTQFTATTVNATETGYVWRASSPLVASVDAAGRVSAHAAGECTIFARGAVSGKEGGFPVVVTADPVAGVPFLAEWSSSGHADRTAEAFRHWDGDGAVPTTCARCHSTHGYRDFLGDDGSTPGVVDQPAALGTTVECSACHNAKTAELRTVKFPSGVVVPNGMADEPLGREAVCMQCHQGRESGAGVDTAIAAAAPANVDTVLPDQGFLNVHYFPAAATRYGGVVKGGYLYPGKSYDVLFKHVPGRERCQDCHNPHTLEIRLDVCAECHNVTTMEDLHDIRMQSSLTRDYDGDGNLFEGIYFEVAGLRQKLLLAIQAYCNQMPGLGPIAYEESRYPYFFKDTNGNGVADAGELSNGNRYTAFTARLLKATFNFQYATKDTGGYAHNGKFIIQLLHDSIADLNAPLVNKVDMTGAVRSDRGHFDGTAEAFRHWDADGFVSQDCARCHSASAGFGEFLTYGTNTSKPIANGFDCAVCHTTFDTFATRRIEEVEFRSGLKTPAIGAAVPTNDPLVQSNMCISCHQGRTSKKDIDDAIAQGKLAFQNIHYLAAAATLFGTDAKVGYEYDGKTYRGKFPHVSTNPTNTNNCVFCHSAVQTKHTFLPADNIDTCRLCHTLPTNSLTDIRVNSTADYDGDGKFPGSAMGSESLKDEVATMSLRLYEAMQAHAAGNGKPLFYDTARYPYFFNDTNGNGVGDPGENSSGNRFTAWTPALVKAAHNYQHSLKEPGAWAHNFAYIVQLLYDSIEDLGGDVSGYTRP